MYWQNYILRRAHVPPPDSTRTMSVRCLAVRVSHAIRFALMSSRMAAWGQPPVSIATILREEDGDSAESHNRKTSDHARREKRTHSLFCSYCESRKDRVGKDIIVSHTM